jgi:hypothetical protein
LKRAWMPFWRSVSAALLVCLPAQAQHNSPSRNKPNADSIEPHRYDELTLAGLRPGRDVIAKAQHLFSKPATIEDGGTTRTWQDACRHGVLSLIADTAGKILEVRVAQADLDSKRECGHPGPGLWVTGHGLVIGNSCSRALALYGQPNSRGPSTKDGQQLELLYYAFDWAGPDVPQVMEVLCTPERGGKPGRVVEITLAAPSL